MSFFPNYKVVDFQPRTLTTTEIGSVAYCYIHLFDQPQPPFLLSNVPPPQLYFSVLPIYKIILPPGIHLSPYHHTKKPVTLPSLTRHNQIPTIYLLPHPPPPDTNYSSLPSPLPRLPDYRRRRSQAASEISFSVVFSCCSEAVCCEHCLCNLPPPSYTVSFEQTSKIVRGDTHSANVA